MNEACLRIEYASFFALYLFKSRWIQDILNVCKRKIAEKPFFFFLF